MRSRVARAWLVGYLVASLLEIVTELTGPALLSDLLPVVLMPLLAAYVLRTGTRSRMVVLVVCALGFSWLGDCLGFSVLAKIAFFLVAHLCYIVAFWPLRRRSLFARPVLLIGYVVGFGVLVAYVSVHAGPLGPAVAVYGASLGLMIGLASGVHPWTLVGAALFLVSDLTLAREFFFTEQPGPWSGVLVMATYLPAQLLIVAGGVCRVRESGPVSRTAGGARMADG